MLTWEEDIKPASQNNFALPPQPPMSALASPIFGGALPVPHVTPEDLVPAAVARRVKASDKRIINGQTDVNQLVPFKYKWAADVCKKGNGLITNNGINLRI